MLRIEHLQNHKTKLVVCTRKKNIARETKSKVWCKQQIILVVPALRVAHLEKKNEKKRNNEK